MKTALALLTVLIMHANSALAGGTMVTCNAQNIVVLGTGMIDLTVVPDAYPTNTIIGWHASPNDAVIIFCRNGQLTIGANGEQPIQMVLTPQEGATISQE